VRFPRSLRWQLMLAFTGIVALVVLAAALGMAMLIEHAVWAPLDAALQEEAETLTQLRAIGRVDFLGAVAREAGDHELGAGKFIRVTAPDGHTLAESGTMPLAVAALARAGVPAPPAATIAAEKGPYRVVWYAAADGSWAEIGVRVGRHVRTLERARLAIAGAAAVLLAALMLLAWEIPTHATAELDRLLARLEAAVGHLRRFTADAAHELRTPIAALRAHLDVALARERSAEAYRAGLLDALEQTERLERLAADLLTLSAVEAGVGTEARREMVRLDALAREVAEFLEPVAQEQGRHFACRVERPVTVRGTPDLLKRLVLNLVDNAFRHTPPTAAVELSVRAEDGAATIEVRDAGPGVPAADLPEVFERFRRGPGPTAGTGLGLALCREITTRHGGQIALESAPAAGTTVTVTLPLAAAEPQV